MPASAARKVAARAKTTSTPSKVSTEPASTPAGTTRAFTRGTKRKADSDEAETLIRQGKRPKKPKAMSKVANEIKENPTEVPIATPVQKQVKRTRTRKSAAVKLEAVNGEEETLAPDFGEENIEVAEDKEQDETQKTPRKKRKTKEQKEAETMPLAARTTGGKYFVGAHVSMAKGLQNSVTNSLHIGGNAFALFLKSQRKWDNPPLEDENRDLFRRLCSENGYDQKSHVMPHGSYLVNLAHGAPDREAQAYDAFLDDLRRCEALGIRLYNFHPGAASTSPLPEAITRLANQLNKALSATSTVMPVLENMAGGGTVIGSRFSDMGAVISQIAPEHRHRIGVCIDTCHAFAAGYDLRTPESFAAVLDDFDEIVGMQYLKGLHLNDSKAPLGAKRDLHQNIGLGFLGLRAFHNVMNEPRFQGLPLILETPIEKPDPDDETGKKTIEDKSVWATEIKMLESLTGMDAEGEVFKKMEEELSAKGTTERQKYQEAYDTKLKKEKVKAEKGQKSLLDMIGGKKRKESKKAVESAKSGSSTDED